MGTLLVRVGNARREPLPDHMDVQVASARSDRVVGVARNVPGQAEVKFENLHDHEPYIVRVFPMRHRPVAQFAIPKPGDPVHVQLYAPLHPDRVTDTTFPPYADIDADLRRVLECSAVEGVEGSGPAIYEGLTPTQKAGMFNLFAKMTNFGFAEDRNVWTYVDSLYRIRADRVFVDVQPALRDLVKSGVAEDRFREASGKLHTPPAGFVSAGSFKTDERYGNLQLSFFSSLDEPLRFKVDADIDDAAGLGHVFQVLRNFITKGTTHPYDIHQILVFRQEVELPYQLA
jgi:hypothetical protein